MAQFTVSVGQRDFSAMVLPQELNLTYVRGSAAALGGMQEATIVATGPRYALYAALDWLRCPVVVYNRKGTAVWWGYVAAINGDFADIGPNGNPDSVTLTCRGWFFTLSATYYARPEGKIQSSNNRGTAIVLGQKLTANTIGFEPNNDYIHDIGGRLNYFASDQWVQVSGSASNNGAFRVARGTNQTSASWASTSIWFNTSDDILTTASNFAFVDANDLILVSGATYPSNNGYFWVDTVQDGNHIVTVAKTITSYGTGPLVTVARGNAIGCEANFVRENPGATVTLTTIGEKLAQSFVATGSANWKAYEAQIRVMKVNSPLDGVTIDLCADNAGSPGTVLDTATLSAANLPTSLTWMTFAFTGAATLTIGATYWLVIRRSGASEYANYYQVDVDEDQSYAAGTAKAWNGVAWITPPTPVDIPFAVFGKEETTTQLAAIATSAEQFLAGSQIMDTSGLLTYQYREGRLRAYDEALALLAAGTSDGRRLLAEVTPQRYLSIYKEPLQGSADTYVLKGAFQVGLSLDEIANRVQIIYAYQDPTGKSVKGTTAWVEDANSRATYGTWELIKSLGNANADQAIYNRDLTLSTLKQPVGVPTLTSLRATDLLDNMNSPLEEGVLPAGKWVEVRGLPSEVAATTKITPFMIDEVEYDAESGELRITPRGAWTTVAGIKQG